MSQQIIYPALLPLGAADKVVSVASATANLVTLKYSTPSSYLSPQRVIITAATRTPGVDGVTAESLSMVLDNGSFKDLLIDGVSDKSLLYFPLPFTLDQATWPQLEQPIRIYIGTNIGDATSPSEGEGYVTLYPAEGASVGASSLYSTSPTIICRVEQIADIGVTALTFSIKTFNGTTYVANTDQYIRNYAYSFVANRVASFTA